MFDIAKMFTDGVQWEFLVEIVGRTIIMFIIILLVLRLSGRRGVRQLTLFEVAIILGLGSAAGDPMFQDDIPVLHGIVVMFVIIAVYKLITWAASKSRRIHHILEGREMLIVKDGMFEIKHEGDGDFSHMEFFAELRNLSVEHLGQVRIALLETDGSISVLYYPDEEVRYGLPLFHLFDQQITLGRKDSPHACQYCGYVVPYKPDKHHVCERCKSHDWVKAICTKRIN